MAELADIIVAHAPRDYPSASSKLMQANFNDNRYADAWTRTAQMFLCLFFTELGSIPSEPTRGTTFMAALRGGAIRDEMMLQAQFNVAMQAIMRYLAQRSYFSTTDPEVQFRDARLLRASIDRESGRARLDLELISGTGAAYRYTIPLPWKP